jgi:hypothetical protein
VVALALALVQELVRALVRALVRDLVLVLALVRELVLVLALVRELVRALVLALELYSQRAAKPLCRYRQRRQIRTHRAILLLGAQASGTPALSGACRVASQLPSLASCSFRTSRRSDNSLRVHRRLGNGSGELAQCRDDDTATLLHNIVRSRQRREEPDHISIEAASEQHDSIKLVDYNW